MIDIIIPVYNEADNIVKTFAEIAACIKSPKRVLIVYDFDEDNTLPVVGRHREEFDFEIQMVKNDRGPGVINAIITGFSNAVQDKVLVMMADLSDKLDVVDLMVAKMDEGYDVVCGSRYMRGGEQRGGPFLKSLFSRTAGLSLHLLTAIPTHDVTNSFKLYSKRLLDAVHIESTGGFEIGLEITVKAYCLGYLVTEVPSQWQDRVDGTSNFHMWKWMPRYLHWYFYCIHKTWFGKRKVQLR